MFSTRNVIIMIVSQLISLTGAYYGYDVYQSSGQMWHFVVLLGIGMGFALAFIEATIWYYGDDNEKE